MNLTSNSFAFFKNLRAMICLAFLIAINAIGCSVAISQSVTVQMRSDAVVVSDWIVRLGDVATVTSTNSTLADSLRKLELEDFQEKGSVVEVSRDQIFWRLMMAGVTKEQVNIAGLDKVRVGYRSNADLESDIAGWLTEQLAHGFGVDPKTVSVSLPSDYSLVRIRQSWLEMNQNPAQLRLPNRLVPGKQNILFETVTSGGASTLVAWPITVTLHQPVAIAKRLIPANTVITDDDVQNIERPISDPNIKPVSAEEIMGRSVNRDIHALEMVVSQSIATALPAPQKPAKETSVRAGSHVAVVLRTGRLELTLPDARALQSGSGGEVIEVENLSSHKRLVCRVIDERTVELVR